MIWFTADTHFGHDRLKKLERDDTFSSIEEMDEELISRWNEVVGFNDQVWHLGDVAWRGRILDEIMPRLNGQKQLVPGNHDNLTRTRYLRYFDEVWPEQVNFSFDGVMYSLSHYPEDGDPDHYRLHGHVHHAWKAEQGMLNVGVDAWDYRPISLECIENWRLADPIFGGE
jgi:calcineurin-like phosphoesterase family protein